MCKARRQLLFCAGLALTLALQACGGAAEGDERVVASYRDKQLTRAMLKHYLPDDVPAADSARIASAFVQQWIKEQAVMDEALIQYAELAQEVEYKVQDYRAKLIMHAYQTRLLEEQMDKGVSKQEIRTYYEANKQSFISDANLYQYFYIATREKDNGQLDNWMRSNSTADHDKLVAWAAEHALDAKVDSSYVGDEKIELVSKGYPGELKNSAPGKLIRWNGVIRGERRYYFFKMISSAKVGEPKTLDLCRDKIAELMLNERRVSLIEKNEERILQNARSNNYIK